MNNAPVNDSIKKRISSSFLGVVIFINCDYRLAYLI